MGITNQTDNDNVNEQPKCYFLSIPGELRNRIYELAFSSMVDRSLRIRLIFTITIDHERYIAALKADSPCAGLLLTNKQVRNEARLTFEKVNREDYWRYSKFYIDVRGLNCSAMEHALSSLDANDLALMQNLSIESRTEKVEMCGGVWLMPKRVVHGKPEQVHRRYVYVPEASGTKDGTVRPATAHGLKTIKLDHISVRGRFAEQPDVVDVTDMEAMEVDNTLRIVGRSHLTEAELISFSAYV